MKYKLIANETNPKDGERIYTYEGEDSSKVRFQADRDVAFSYSFYKSSTVKGKARLKFLDAFVAACIDSQNVKKSPHSLSVEEWEEYERLNKPNPTLKYGTPEYQETIARLNVLGKKAYENAIAELTV